jgi:hypothetical protein
MKSSTNSQGVALLNSSLDRSLSWGFLGRIFKFESLDEEAISNIVAWHPEYAETSLKIDPGSESGYRGLAIVP